MGLIDKISDVRSVMLAITTAIGLAGSVFGGVMYVDARYAKADTVSDLSVEVQILELRAQLREAQEEYFFLKKQARRYPDDEDIRDELFEVKQAIIDIKDFIKQLERQQQ